ncbi:histidine phosphatase family protein [Rubellimicrobium rubrum]|uniref:Histidine phosphatase family protein n=1 Tax=Rubellimicrobium rubrum TaxID=2585369 RepID=A0A5C4MYZ8_9RHOB|nr:histidine phosphatase family protein [Rubellimicrobium rubrum]TNC49350.1 histidine phosphatase family protein [Rubellimicrobium rubrum]
MHLYLTHPQVRIDPTVPVPLWGLSAQGLARTEALAARPWLRAFRRIVASEETKAWDTAAVLGAALGLMVEVRPGLHENDRSATGFLPRAEFEAVADLFFAHPDRSALGWETARNAQARILDAVRAVIDEAPDVPTLVVGHGAVGTLLKCALGGRPISRREDQPDGGGNHLGFTLEPAAVLHDWRPMEDAPPEP